MRGRISKDGKGPGCNRVEAVHGGDDLQAHARNSADVSHTQRIGGITKRWVQGLILKLLEATHGQWIYRNIQIHDMVAGTQVTLRKESIQREIEEKMEMEQGVAGLLEEDHWMMEVNLGDMETTSGEQKEYWLLAVKAA
jgi:hypothetical protein